jgi:hypothetical protein
MLLLSGCWAAGIGAGVSAAHRDSGGSETPAINVPAVFLNSSFIPVDDSPTDVLIVDIVPPSYSDIVVLSRTSRRVTVLEGDAELSFLQRQVVELSSLPFAAEVATLGGATGLIVATIDSLEYIQWNPGLGNLEVIKGVLPLRFETGARDIAVGEFDGIPGTDVAVSSNDGLIDIYTSLTIAGSRLGMSLQASLHARGVPRAIAAADFDGDDVDDIASVEAPDLVCLYLFKQGIFRLEDTLTVPDLTTLNGGFIEAHNGVLFGTEPEGSLDPASPDLLVGRRPLAAKILVTHTPAGPRLEPFTEPTGPSCLETVDGAVVHLPRCVADGPSEPCNHVENHLWDVVAADPSRNAVVVGYTKASDGGIAKAKNPPEAIYPVAGTIQALAVGHINDDELEDIVAISVYGGQPSGVVTILLSQDQHEPFRYKAGELLGERRPIDKSLAGPFVGNTERLGQFLAVFTAPNKLQISLVSEDDQGLLGEPISLIFEELNGDTPFEPAFLTIADVDNQFGDDIVVTGSSGTIVVLRAKPAAAMEPFAVSGIIRIDELFAKSGIGPSVESIETPASVVAQLDGDRLPDLITVVKGKDEDGNDVPTGFICVIQNFVLPNPEARFVATLAKPRRAVVANLNGDVALDLLVACEDVNKIQVIFGDPESPGLFLDSPSFTGAPSFRRNVMPMELDGLKHANGKDAEAEFVWTDSQGVNVDSIAKFIFVAGGGVVGVYCVEPIGSPGGRPRISECQRVFSGADPEVLVLGDVLGDAGRDLVITDEDANEVVLIENIDSQVELPDGVCSPWDEKESRIVRLRIAGRPREGVAIFSHGADQVLAVRTKPSDKIQTYLIPFQCGNDCNVTNGPEVGLGLEPRQGLRTGLSGEVLPDDVQLIASLQEDADLGTGVVDLELLANGAICEKSSVNFAEDLDAVAVGRFATSGHCDLIVHTAAGQFLRVEGVISEVFGQIEETACGNAGSVAVVPDPDLEPGTSSVLQLSGPLMELECVHREDKPDLVLVATESEVAVLDSDAILWSKGWANIEAVACGSIHGGPGGTDMCLAVIGTSATTPGGGQGLFLCSKNDGPRSLLASGVSGIVGCQDLDNDGMDEVILVTFEVTGVAEENGGLRSGNVFVFMSGQRKTIRSGLIDTGNIPLQPVDLAFLDANSDGKPDLCVGTASGSVYLLLGDGHGRFPENRHSRAFAGPGLEAIVANDFTKQILASVAVPGLVILDVSNDAQAKPVE